MDDEVGISTIDIGEKSRFRDMPRIGEMYQAVKSFRSEEAVMAMTNVRTKAGLRRMRKKALEVSKLCAEIRKDLLTAMKEIG